MRQYRFLLRQTPPDAVEAAHHEALRRLEAEQRQVVLSAIQEGLVAGQRLHPWDSAQMAHLIVLGEKRMPSAFLSACEQRTLAALAYAVVHSEACLGLFGPYADWDGADPEPEDQSAWADAGFNPDSGRWNTARRTHLNEDGVVGPVGGGGGGGGS